MASINIKPGKTITKEKGVKDRVKKLLDKHKWFWWMPPANGFGRTGISDFNALRDGVFMAVETKFGSNTASPMQKSFLSSIAATDGFAFIVSEKNIDNFAAWLEAFDKSVEYASKEQMPPDDIGAAMIDNIRALIQGY